MSYLSNVDLIECHFLIMLFLNSSRIFQKQCAFSFLGYANILFCLRNLFILIFFSPFYLFIFPLRSCQYNAALVHLLYFSTSWCPPIFHRRLRCNSAGVLFYVFTFFFILFCKVGYVLCRQMSIVVIFAISFTKFYLVL